MYMEDFQLKLKPTIQAALALLPAPTKFDKLVECIVHLDHV